MIVVRMFRWAIREILHVLPAFIFFCIAFNIINLTESFLFKRAGIVPFTFVYVTLSAVVIAKVLLVIDHLPIVNLFPNRPLIFTTLWKTIFYWAINLFVRLSIRFSPYLLQDGKFFSKIENFYSQMDWNLFVGVQSFYLMLFALFVFARELNQALGPGTIRRIFLGPRNSFEG